VAKGVFGRDLILDSIIFYIIADLYGIYCYGSGSGSFHQQAKKRRQALISTVLGLLI
jgi:hypothetical protein